jgi:hypothetical protein
MQVSVGLHVSNATVLYNDSLGRGAQSATAGRVLEVVIRWAYIHRLDFAVTALSQVCQPAVCHACELLLWCTIGRVPKWLHVAAIADVLQTTCLSAICMQLGSR